MFWKPPCRTLLAALILINFIGEVAGQEKCDCNCCQTSGRQGTNQVNGQTVICSVTVSTDGSSSSCPSECDATAENSVVSNTQEGTIQASRFCSHNCLPVKDELGAACRKLTDEEQAQLLTAGKNGQDPAALLMPTTTEEPQQLEDPNAPPEPPQLLDQQALAAMLSGAPSPASANVDKLVAEDQKKAEEWEAKETGGLVADASGKNAMASGIAARIGDAEALSANGRSYADGDLQIGRSQALIVGEAQAQVQAAEVRAAIYAKSAQKAAASAEAELKEIQEIPKKAAQYAADLAKQDCCGELQDLANKKAIVQARLAPPALAVPLAEAAVRAAQPYYDVMQKAVSMGGLYEQSARTLQDQAQTLEEQSRSFAAQAVAYQGAGYGDMASKLMAEAKKMLVEAASKSEQAKKDFAVAEGVRKQVPVYQANAAAASARATAIANPAGQPPPAMVESLVQRSNFLRKVSRL